MTVLFEKLRAAEQQAEAQAQQEYKQLVLRLANGTDDDLGRVQEILADANKTASELEQDVSLCQRRQAWRQQMADAQQANEQRGQIEQKIDKANAALEKAKQKHAETLWPLRQQIEQANGLAARGADAERQLRETCPKELRIRQQQNGQALREILIKVRGAKDALEKQQAALAAANGRDGWQRDVGPINPDDKQIFADRIKRLQAELAELEKQQQAIADEGSEIEKLILEA